MGLRDLISDILHNRNLYKSGKANRNEVRSTTVGWRPDPINGEDGYTGDPGNERVVGKDENGYEIYDTPSCNREYYKVVRSKKR